MTTPKKLSKLEMMKIATGASEEARIALAKKTKSLPHDVINQLARDTSSTVREVVAFNLFSTISTPYSAFESLYCVVKHATGLSKRNAGIVKNLPHSFTLNTNIEPRYTLTFVGDIMPTANHFVHISDDLKEFLSNSDYLIANFEGTITEAKKCRI